MNAPTLFSSRVADTVATVLTETISIERDANRTAIPQRAPSWSTIHANVAAQVKRLTTGEGRESRSAKYTIAADAISVVAEGWLSGVLDSDRLLFDGQYYDILGVSQVGDFALTKIIAQRRAA